MDRFSLLHASSRSLRVRLTARLALLLLAAVAVPAWVATPAQAGSVTGLFSFSGPPDGLSPVSGPVQGNDGNFYGVVPAGGPRNNGTVYRLTPAGVLTTLYSFTGFADGGSPSAALVLGNDGNFYGTTPSGGANPGANGGGTVFRITPAGVLTTLHSFSGDADGGNPQALVRGSDGNFYGTTRAGGLSVGTIFQVTPTGNFTTLYALHVGYEVGTDGYNIAALVQGRDGNFYGAASAGGTEGDGTIFRFTPAGVLTTLYNFTGSTDGGVPVGAMAVGADGNLYGTTAAYGDSSANQGTVFRVTTDGMLTTLHTFKYFGDGGSPTTGLVLGSDGNLYGATNQGGANNQIGGTVFQITPAGVLTTLYSFSGGGDGNFPGTTLALDTGGRVYGVTNLGGAGGYGTAFRLTTSGALTTLFTFRRPSAPVQPTVALTKGNDGNFYGTTQFGGLYDNGTVFRVTPAGAVMTLYSFTGGADGNNPAVALTLGNDGNFYGTANGNNNEGSVFKITSAGALTTIHAFTGGLADGGVPALAPLVKGSDGNFYGANVSYPAGDGFSYFPGSIYRITPAGAVTILHVFNAPSGDGHVVGLVQGRDGNFYGTSEGGTAAVGRVFQLTPAGVLTVLYNFDGGVHGGNPAGALIQGRDGKFYGTTQSGGTLGGVNGATDGGTVYSITPAGSLTTLASFGGGAGGTYPRAGLAQGADGNFYGTTLVAGTYGQGTVFRVTRAGVLKSLYSFTSGADGGLPLAGLTLGTDNNFYGTTEAGGTNGLGGIFRLRVIQASSNPIAVGVPALSNPTTEKMDHTTPGKP